MLRNLCGTSAAGRHVHFLNEVLSLNAQEYLRRGIVTTPTRLSSMKS